MRASSHHRISRQLPLIFSGLITLMVLLSGYPEAARAQFTWTGNSTQSNYWSDVANWNSLGTPVSSVNTILDFTGTTTSSNDYYSGNFTLNMISCDVATSVFNVSGGTLNFVSNGGTTPVLNQDTTAALNISNSLILSNNLTLNQNNSGTITLSGAISGTGSLTLSAVQSSSTTILSSSSNSFSGGLSIAGGTLVAGVNNALPANDAVTLLGSTADSILDLHGSNQTIGNLTFGSSQSTYNTTVMDSSPGATGTLTLGGNVSYSGSINGSGNAITPPAVIAANLALTAGQHSLSNPSGNYSNGAYDLVITSNVSGSGGLNISGGLNVVLAGTGNTYAGATDIAASSLYLNATNALPNQTAVTVDASNGFAGLFLQTISTTSNNTVLAGGSFNQSIGSLSGSGNVYLGSAILTVGNANTSTYFSGQIQDDGTGGSIVKVGSGTLTLSSLNTYSGSTTVDAGTLALGYNNALPIGTNLILNGGQFKTGVNSQTIGNLTNSGGTNLINGGALTVSGAYTQNSGTTQVDGNLTAADTNMALAGGYLVGTGYIIGTVANTSGVLTPGDEFSTQPTGKLTINGNYTQAANGKLWIDLGGTGQGTTYDQLAVLNTAALNGELDVKLVNGFRPTVGETFNFLTYGNLTGSFANIFAEDSGYSYTVSNYGGSQNNYVTLEVMSIAAVPETSTLAALFVMLVNLGRLRFALRKQ